MCGVTGFLTNKEFQEQTIVNMTKKLFHRGPDSNGYWIDKSAGLALGHTRLAILDLSENGHQPMVSPSGRYVLSYNGEIYNHLEIRDQIEKTSLSEVVWKGSSDSETILHAIEKWGIKDSLNIFTGQFAIAIWDKKIKKLFLARDRFGEKPLYYGFLPNSFVFSSELKSLREHEDFNKKISNIALNLYLKLNYVPSPFSIYENIYKLNPGSILEISNPAVEVSKLNFPFNEIEHNDFKISSWWSIDKLISNKIPKAYAEESSTIVEKKLQESVRLQSISDVPVGCFLSGGIDSSVIALLMQRNSKKPINTFTVGFEEEGYDEANYAKDIAEKIGTNHKEIFVTSKEAQEVVPLISTIYDEPFSDVSQIPTYLISKLAKEHVTVVLSGDGGDELFGGYNRYRFGPSLWALIKYMPKSVRYAVFKMILLFPPSFLNRISFLFPKRFALNLLGEKVHNILSKLISVKDEKELYGKLVTLWQEEERVLVKERSIYDLPDLLGEMNQDSTFEENMMFFDAKSYLSDDILVKVDRASMSNSLETRVPFLNHELYEISLSIDLDQKIKKNKGKIILQSIFNKYFPEIDLTRPKQGFSVPIGDWLRGPLMDWAQKLLDPKRIESEGFFEADKINKYWQEHQSGKRNWDHRLWNILVFQSWLEDQNYEESR